MKKTVLLCVASGSEEIEVVTTFDLLVRAGFQVHIVKITDNNDDDHNLVITGSVGFRILADVSISTLSGFIADAVVLPGGMKGVECFQRNKLLMEYIRGIYLEKKIVAAICAAPALVLQHYKFFNQAKMTSFPSLKKHIPTDCWIDQRVVYDERYKLITSQGPGTAMDFALKIIELLGGRSVAAKVASQLLLPRGIEDYQV